jgi:hypothetical protein
MMRQAVCFADGSAGRQCENDALSDEVRWWRRYVYEIHGRLVLDVLDELWKIKWIGQGGSYLWTTTSTAGQSARMWHFILII